MFKNKGFSAVAIVIILAVLALGGYTVWKKQTITPPSAFPKGEGTPTSPLGGGSEGVENWKTYTDSELGLSFKYPPTWKEPERRIQSTKIDINFGNGFSVVTGFYYNQNEQRQMTIDELVNSTMSESHYKNIKRETLNLAGKASTKVSYTTVFGKETDVYIPRSSQSDIVLLSSDHTVDVTTFANILSTFRFIKSSVLPVTSDISNWKTYRNEKYGFDFKYPASFVSCGEKYKTQIQTSNLEGGKILIDCYTTNINDPSIQDDQTIIWSLFVERKLFSEYPQFSSLKDYFEKQKQDAVKNLSAYNEYSPYQNFEEVSISGNKYLKTGVCDASCGLVYYVFLKNQILSIHFFHGLGDNTALNAINNILSTFRFVK